MINIRKAKHEDAARLESLYSELERDAVFYQPQHFKPSEEGARARQVKDILDSGSQTVIVAELDGVVIGFAHVVLTRSKDFPCLKPQYNVYIQDLVVTQTHRRSGAGTMLMDAVKRYGTENGAEFVRTQVFPMNEDGLRFYRRNGFTETMVTIECPLT